MGSPQGLRAGFAAILLFVVGCPQTTQSKKENNGPEPPPVAVATRVLVVDDAHLADAIEREWRAHSEEALTVKRLTGDELGALRRLGADVLIFPAERFGELVEADRLMPIPPESLAGEGFARSMLFPRLRDDLGTWGRNTYALPLGTPTYQLLYRSDVFEKLGLMPPTTWAEYQELLPKLSDRAALGELVPQDGAWSPSVEPLADGWGGKLLLARAAAYAADARTNSPYLDLNMLEPRIASPPYLKALEELAAAAKDNAGWLEITPDGAREQLLSGKAAMAITWLSGVREEGLSAIDKAPPIRIAPLPGSAAFYSLAAEEWQPREENRVVAYLGTAGCLAAAAKDCWRPSVALHFVAWLTNSEASDRLSSQAARGSPTRETQAARAGLWVAPPLAEELGGEYFTLLRDDLSRGAALPPLRLPSRAKMEAALDRAVAAAVAGDRTPAEALAEASANWRQMIGKLEAEQVRAFVRRGMNLSQ